MTPAQHQLLARVLAVVIAAAGALAGWDIVQGLSREAAATAAPTGQGSADGGRGTRSSQLTQAEIERLDTLRMQGGEAEAQPAGSIKLPPPQARAIKLLGTLIPSQGPPEGLFVDARNRLVVARPGEELPGGARVESVADGEATLSVKGRTVTLLTERKRRGQASGGGS